VRYIGYGGGRGLPAEHALLPAAGFAMFVMDTRGQGGQWTVGATGDIGPGPEYSAVMTRGIASPESYYYTRLYTDAVLAAETAAGLAGVDETRIAVSGGSQGGGLALATAALLGDAVAVCLLSVGLMDDTCPPSTVFAAYNEITSPKDIAVSPFGVHEVPAVHLERQLSHLRDRLGA